MKRTCLIEDKINLLIQMLIVLSPYLSRILKLRFKSIMNLRKKKLKKKLSFTARKSEDCHNVIEPNYRQFEFIRENNFMAAGIITS